MSLDDETADALRDRARALWGLGEYGRVAARLQPAAEVLVEAADVQRDQEVLDVAAGTGNVAIVAAQRGARVTATDLSPALIELGRARTEGLGIEWQEADAEDLPYVDGRFDAALSAFGAMFAPRQGQAAAELLRVVRPGGTAAMTAWVPEGVLAAAGVVVASRFPKSPAPLVPDDWGDPVIARRHFEAGGAAPVTVERRTLAWEFESPQAFLSFMERDAPPVVAARQVLDDEQWDEVRAELLKLVPGGSSAFVIEPPYLLITARRA